MSESTVFERGRRLIVEEWDILVMLAFFIFLTWQALGLGDIPRQFPLLFLVFGLIAMTIELAVHLLPSKYGRPIRRLTTGIAAEIDDTKLPKEDQAEDERARETVIDDTYDREEQRRLFVWTLVLVIAFGVLSFYISFLLALPLFVFAIMYKVGEGNSMHATVTTIVLLLLMYFVFAELMNVPIDTGVLIGAEDFIPQ